MFILNKRNIISLILALLLAGGFLWAVLTPPSIFNALPFEIHKSFDPGGSSESDFIIGFDVFSAVIVFFISYILARNCFKAYKLFSDNK